MGAENDLLAYIKHRLKEHEHQVLKYEHFSKGIEPNKQRKDHSKH